ncbi:hypothetical protein [Clostridium estertheticum]|nr:hypothetical protein [Clostridium estertheticum]MCB2354374.1 hypothetical protein [Clostridium estertheticum]WAG42507.1 hypothetical protein LL065_07495 [Clostridium estertheticum]
MEYIEKFTKFITKRFILKLKWKYLLAFCEGNIIIISITILIISRKYLGDLSLFVFFFYLLIWSLIISYIRKERRNMFSLLDKIYAKINTNNYFINRINLLFDQGLSIMILIGGYMFTLLILTQLEWPLPLQYLAFASLAIYLIIWIYFSLKFKLNDDATINIRRIIVYILIVVYVVLDCYSKFYSIVTYETSPKLDLNNLLVYITSVSFIALDRVMKSIVEDSKVFGKR